MKKLINIAIILVFILGCEKLTFFEELEYLDASILKSASLNIVVPENFLTIQEAVNAAADGNTIIVKEGVYPELLKIYQKNDITLIGVDALICPPEGIENGEGSFNIEVLECSNVRVLNFRFNGNIDESRVYPIDRAIVYNGSSGEISNNKITGYGLGIASDNQYPSPFPFPVLPDLDAMINLKVSKNNISNCYGQIGITGNYNFDVSQNIISYSFDKIRSFDNFFPHWNGIEIESGTGTVTKNKIKLKNRSEFLNYAVGIRLMKRDAADHIQGMMVDLHDVDVNQNIIHGPDVGITINSYDPLPGGEVWCVRGVELLFNKFIKVDQLYDINNDCENVVIKP